MTIFCSDLHIGSRLCKADAFCRFLSDHNGHKAIFLVGDLFDLDVSMRFWPSDHIELIKLIIEFDKIVYLPGNHDEALLALLGLSGRINIAHESIYQSGHKRYLVTHGDRYDPTTMLAVGPRWLRAAVSRVYTDAHSNMLAGLVQRRAVADARKLGFDGVICGHTHHPMQVDIGGIEYINLGDWVLNCTAVIDNDSGLKLVTYNDAQRQTVQSVAGHHAGYHYQSESAR